MRKIYNSTVISSRFNGGSIGAGNQNLTKLCCEHLHITHKVNLVQFSHFQIEEIEPECFSKQMYNSILHYKPGKMVFTGEWRI
jgi:hypothetical protein